MTSPSQFNSFISLALATHRQPQSATPKGDGLVISSSIATGREAIDMFNRRFSINRTVALHPRHNHSSIPQLKSSKCSTSRASTVRLQATEAQEI
jgi:hypothetical protein